MNTTEQIKRKYSSPRLTSTILDNSISLELQSDPPPGPGESVYNNTVPDFFNNNNPLNA